MFRGQLVELKAIEPDNLGTYTRWFQDPEVLRLLTPATVKPWSSVAEKRAIERMARGGDDAVHFAIHVLTDGQLIGNCSLQAIDGKNRTAGLGIVIGERAYWGRGFGSDALRLMLRYGFSELNLHRIWLKVLAFNERAIRAYNKIGFVEEGRLREAVYRDGRYWDELMMAVLRTEYGQARPAAKAAADAEAPALPAGGGSGA